MDETIKDDVFTEVEAAVEEKVNVIVNPKSRADHEVGGLNFLRKADVSKVQEERSLLAGYGETQFDCDCNSGTRNDFQECVPIDNRDVSFKNLT